MVVSGLVTPSPGGAQDAQATDPGDGGAAGAGDAAARTTTRRRPNRNTRWGVFAYVALTLVTLAVIWGLVLITILVTRSGDTTSEMLRMVDSGQQTRQDTIDELGDDLDDARETAVQEARASREQISTSASRAADVSQQNAAAWQDIARESGAALGAASDRRLSAVEAALERSEDRRAAAEAATRAALDRAESRRAAAEARADQAAAAARTAARRADLESRVDASADRLDRAQLEHDLLRELRPGDEHDPDLDSARQHLTDARTSVDAARSALRKETGPLPVVSVTRLLTTARTALDKAERDLSRARTSAAADDEPDSPGTAPHEG